MTVSSGTATFQMTRTALLSESSLAPITLMMVKSSMARQATMSPRPLRVPLGFSIWKLF